MGSMERTRRRSQKRNQYTGFSAWEREGDLLHRAPFVTDEEQWRDEMITDLLEVYINAYECKVERNKEYRSVILWTCISIIVFFALILALLPFQVMEKRTGLSMTDAVAFMTASVSFLALVIGVLHIGAVDKVPPQEPEIWYNKNREGAGICS